MKTNHKRFNRDIPAYLEGTLSERGSRLFERDLAASEACRRELAAYERLLGMTRQVPVEYPSDAAWERFLPRLHQRIERQYSRQVRERKLFGFLGWELRPLLAGTGSLVLLAGLLTAARMDWFAPTSSEVVQVSEAQTANPSTMKIIADSWLTDKQAEKLARINPNSVKTSLVQESSATPIPNSEAVAQGNTTTELETTPTQFVDSLMASTLSPMHLYSEEGSYLTASSW